MFRIWHFHINSHSLLHPIWNQIFYLVTFLCFLYFQIEFVSLDFFFFLLNKKDLTFFFPQIPCLELWWTVCLLTLVNFSFNGKTTHHHNVSYDTQRKNNRFIRTPCIHQIRRQHTQIVPNIHLSAERANLDDGLAQEVVGLALEVLLHPWLDVVIFIPNAHLYSVGSVVAFAVGRKTISPG